MKNFRVSQHAWLCLSLGIFFCKSVGFSQGITFTNLGEYLTNRTWINELEIDLSRNRVKSSLQGFTTWKASVQPGGFFIQCVSNSPYSAMLIFGESTNEYWQTSQTSTNQKSLRGVAIASKSEGEGASTNNSRETMCLFYRQVIKNALNFGIVGLDTDRINWVSSNEFSSPMLNWIGQPITGEIHVTIENWEHGMPTQLRYKTTSPTSDEEYLINCQYDNAFFPPTKTTIEKLINGKSDIIFTNIIRSVVFGTNENAHRGFEPNDFFAEDSLAKNFIVESNGARYSVKTNGIRALLNESPVNPNDPDLWRIRIVRLVLFIFMISPLVFLFWKFLTRNKKEK